MLSIFFLNYDSNMKGMWKTGSYILFPKRTARVSQRHWNKEWDVSARITESYLRMSNRNAYTYVLYIMHIMVLNARYPWHNRERY